MGGVMTEKEREAKIEVLIREQLKSELELGQTVVKILDHWQVVLVGVIIVLAAIYYLGFFVGRSMG